MLRWMIALLSMLCVSTRLAAGLDDPLETKSAYAQDYLRKYGDKVNKLGSSQERVETVRRWLKQDGLPYYDRYLLQRYLTSELDLQEAQEVCRQMTIRSDDFIVQAMCVVGSPGTFLEKRAAMEAIFQKALLERPHTNEAAWVGSYVLNYYSRTNDLAAARRIYEQAMDAVPKQARAAITTLKSSLAMLYALPSNSPETLNQSLQLYTELLEGFRDTKDHLDAQAVAYNRGILFLLAFDDSARAVQDFLEVKPESYNWQDSRVFLAYSLAKQDRKAESIEVLRSVDLSRYDDKDRVPFLNCYLAMTRWENESGHDITACVNLPGSTQADVLFHITRSLHAKRLDADLEIKLWRQFWDFYQNSLAPQMQSQVKAQVDAMELYRARSDAQLKELELRNFRLVKAMLAITILAFVLNVGFFLRLRSRNQRIERLQAYIHKSVLARFLPPLIVEEIIQGKSRMESKPKEESITVLFSDMVGFTALSGKLGAEGISDILNRFMQKMTEVVHRHGGTVDKFIGDAVMVIFGAPIPLPEKEQAERAIACARDMIVAIDEINRDFKQDYGVEVDVRIGINQGRAIVGIFGSEKRADYTAIGPAVNVASRIEGQAAPHEILLSAEVAAHLPAERLENRGPCRLKGVEQDVTLYAIH